MLYIILSTLCCRFLLIIAISIFQLANGFFGTLVSLHVSVEAFSVPLGGLILSFYYAGYTVGAVRCSRIIERIGHIRAFAVFDVLSPQAASLSHSYKEQLVEK